jgi:Bax protein
VQKPVYTPVLGRRSCPLTAPLYAGQQTADDLHAALKALCPHQGIIYSELELEYEYIENAIIKNLDNQRLKELREIYKAKNNQELLIKIKPHPISITLAQAAVESGWATSRFFNIANNLFGVWSFNKDEARVPASETRGKKTIWIKKYENIEDSIRDYYKVLAKGRAYKEFRKLKMETNDPYKLVKKLDKYSERGAIYGKELRAMIKYNKFYRFD